MIPWPPICRQRPARYVTNPALARRRRAELLTGGALHRLEFRIIDQGPHRAGQADWRAGRMKLPDLDNSESMPLPANPGKGAEPMS
jgi:hypothetical protein